ncbi:YhgE/Pip domain-containing protein [Clostridium sp. YIM B02505]|uniref:YhgE/Pip domain-containing protein n=1 Tax=Clostridium yunnanense TaxID=2800325 RepID=A0ABS1EUE0_9CLOT|nr:YhgE/Pip domain-containing protein [Clostridium yunnanense]MBK1812996.1 YhgE/Pip domain-containing protein [Clostridium yunnanense]
MRKVFKVFIRDLKSIFKNPAALVIVIGLCILPSLYAWINIKACWDPYANTGNLPVAIVNSDEGTTFNGKNINAGEQVVAELKKNKSIGWVFVDQWQGNYGLNEGKYYALIEIPSDFSKGLVSLTTVTPKKPDIIYRVNQKLNAIAAKITNAAKEQVAKNIKSNFVDTVNKEALKTINSVGEEFNINKAQIIQIKNTMTEANGDIDAIKKYIAEANSNSEQLQKYLGDVKTKLPRITEQINSLQKATEASKELTIATKQSISSLASTLNNDIGKIQSINNQNQNLLKKLKDINNGTSTDNIIRVIGDMASIMDGADKLVDADIKSLEAVNESHPNSQITAIINSLKALKVVIGVEKNNLDSLKTSINSSASKENINTSLDNLTKISNDLSNQVVSVSNGFYSNGISLLNGIADSMTASLDNMNSILESTKVIVPQLDALANFGIASSKASVQQANDLSNKLSELQVELSKLSDKMKDLSNDNIDQIIKLMKMNPDEIAGFISSPINVNETDVYDAGIFGVGLTPFYTVLAIWVGALLLSSLLTVEARDFEDGERLNFMQRHFGKMLLFLIISMIQAVIVTLGDKYILGVKAADMRLMIIFALASAITFTIIIFTLVSIFGNVGKAIAVIIMVFQIAGAGGIYPIQTNPKIFGILQPLWPFTYAINGFREAIAGPIWNTVYKNLISLSMFALIFIMLSVLKKPFHKLTEFMEHKFKEAGI